MVQEGEGTFPKLLIYSVAEARTEPGVRAEYEDGAHDLSSLVFLSFCFLNFLKKFYCYSVTVVCLFSPSLHPTPAEPTSFPHLHPPP